VVTLRVWPPKRSRRREFAGKKSEAGQEGRVSQSRRRRAQLAPGKLPPGNARAPQPKKTDLAERAKTVDNRGICTGRTFRRALPGGQFRRFAGIVPGPRGGAGFRERGRIARGRKRLRSRGGEGACKTPATPTKAKVRTHEVPQDDVPGELSRIKTNERVGRLSPIRKTHYVRRSRILFCLLRPLLPSLSLVLLQVILA